MYDPNIMDSSTTIRCHLHLSDFIKHAKNIFSGGTAVKKNQSWRHLVFFAYWQVMGVPSFPDPYSDFHIYFYAQTYPCRTSVAIIVSQKIPQRTLARTFFGFLRCFGTSKMDRHKSQKNNCNLGPSQTISKNNCIAGTNTNVDEKRNQPTSKRKT